MNRTTQNHLLFLDGLRGLAALYVVAHHALLQITSSYTNVNLSASFIFLTKWLLFGQMSVDIFIVLSGFCLMLPVVRGDGSLRGGFFPFAKRRAWRLLPPYYAAVMVSLLLIQMVPTLSHPTNGLWALSLPAFSREIILSHLFLVHNLSSDWLHKINYPLWSVATEWQIYFAFALLLLPIWKRFGIVTAIVAACIVSYLLRFFFFYQLIGACFHFLILFAFGMSAAVLAFSREEKYKNLANRPYWAIMNLITVIVFLLLAIARTDWLLAHFSLHDILVGMGTASMLLIMAREYNGETQYERFLRTAVRFLEFKPAVFLGTFSYSLYLIHAPVLAITFSTVSLMHLSTTASFLVCEIVGVPLCVALAYLFHLAFERPFLSKPKPVTKSQVEKAVIISPAP